MNDEELQAARELIEFAREANYNDARFAPKDLKIAARKVEKYLDGWEQVEQEKEITIHVRASENEDGGYAYDIYDCAPDEVEDRNSEDGGQCTGEIEDALDMAMEQTKKMLLTIRANQSE